MMVEKALTTPRARGSRLFSISVAVEERGTERKWSGKEETNVANDYRERMEWSQRERSCKDYDCVERSHQ